MKIYYNSKLKKMARELRRQGILSEVLIWNYLKGRKIRGYQFMRQKPIGDGSSHNDKFDYDLKRQNFLESQGLTVLRFNDIDVKRDIYNVLAAVEGWIVQNNPLAPFTKGELFLNVNNGKCK